MIVSARTRAASVSILRGGRREGKRVGFGGGAGGPGGGGAATLGGGGGSGGARGIATPQDAAYSMGDSTHRNHSIYASLESRDKKTDVKDKECVEERAQQGARRGMGPCAHRSPRRWTSAPIRLALRFISCKSRSWGNPWAPCAPVIGAELVDDAAGIFN